jgi:hypothetical protein
MTLALPCLVALTLLLCGVVAAVPEVVSTRSPRQRPQAAAPLEAERLRIVQGPEDRWYVNGAGLSRAALGERLGRGAVPREVRYLPSASLPMATVAASLRWLRERSDGPVMLELPPPPR